MLKPNSAYGYLDVLAPPLPGSQQRQNGGGPLVVSCEIYWLYIFGQGMGGL